MISPIQSIRINGLPDLERGSQGAQGTGFGELMKAAVESVDRMQKTAHASAESLLRGESEDLHKVALDQQRAALSFDLFLQVRNKAVNAYQEIMRMQV